MVKLFLLYNQKPRQFGGVSEVLASCFALLSQWDLRWSTEETTTYYEL